MFSTRKFVYFLSTCCYLVYGSSHAAHHQAETSALNQHQHDNHVPPNINAPVTVGVTLYVLSFNSFSDKKMELSFDMYFRQFWTDPRLSNEHHTHLEPKMQYGNMPHESIWTPDTFFPTAKDATIHDVMQRNTFTRVTNDSVLYSNKITVILNCPKNYRMFPLDTQVCTMDLESYGYSANQIYYEWHKGKASIGISPDADLHPEFNMLGFRQKSRLIRLSTGNYSRLAVDFVYSRNSASYILKVFFPSTLIVILSWLGFWLNPTNKTARIFLGITSILILVDIFINETDSIPNTNYVKVIDIYLVACLIIVALSLVESVMVIYSAENEEIETEKIVEPSYVKKLLGVCSKCDKYSRIAFPVIFFSFFLIYWITVVRMSCFNMKEENVTPIAGDY